MRSIRLYVACSLIICAIPQYSNAQEYDFPADDMDIFTNDPDFDEMTFGPEDMTRTTPVDTVKNLNDFGIVDLLQHNYYLRTNPLNKRNLLDYPLFLDQKLSYDCPWVVGAHGFYNQTPTSNFTSNSTAISSYLAVCDPALLADVQQTLEQARELGFITNIDPFSFLMLVSPITVEQRRVGAMLHAVHYWQRGDVRILLPLYYLESNFQLGQEEKQALEVVLGAQTVPEQERFQRDHLISDKIGFGDTRLEGEYAIDYKNLEFKLGARATIPTAFAIAKGIVGSSFAHCTVRPNFNFEDAFQGNTPAEIKDNFIKTFDRFFNGALDQLAANLLDTSLGNNGHLGLGGSLQIQVFPLAAIPRPWIKDINLLSKISVEYLLPAHESRYYIKNVDQAGFASRDFTSTNPTVAAENLAFLNDQMVDRFYPYVFKTLASPGFVVEWINKICYEGDYIGATLGNDLWLQGREKLHKIDTCRVNPASLNIEGARLPLAVADKIFGGILFKAKRQTHTFIASVNGDYTLVRSGIGKDFMLTANVEVNF